MRNVIVTGGSRGLGLAIARKLRLAGYCVVAVARRRGDAFAAAMQEREGADVGALHFHPFDLGEIGGIAGLVKGIRREFGPIYGLVNNAAIGTGGVLATMPDRAIETLVRTNTLSPLILTRHVVRSMLAGNGGRIVNVASIVAFAGYSGLAAYSATKASLIGMTRSLAREVGPVGITVNAVAPGFITTELTEGLVGEKRAKIVRRSALRRLAEAEDVADAVEFLLSDKAKNITGAMLTIDAGSTA
ncbi:MAG TPA: SDR family oxidoreductase [Stellaceae bacterium]|nr:SDR family oxidoreductase [Stellaceae bacterium]